MSMAHRSCYLVEWYRPRLNDHDEAVDALYACAASMSGEGSAVQLLMTLAVPTDEVVFGIFGASSAEVVTQACARAGIPAARLSAAFDLAPLGGEPPLSAP